MQRPIIAWLAGVDLRTVRPIERPAWSPPPRRHRLRHLAGNVDIEDLKHRNDPVDGGYD